MQFHSGLVFIRSTLPWLPLMTLPDNWYLNVYNGPTNAILFSDHAIDCEILLRKLGLYGFKGRALLRADAKDLGHFANINIS